MLRPFGTFTVVPSLPPSLNPLRDLAHNLYWSWHLDVVDLFRRLDRDLWEETGHNPLLMLGELSQERLDEAASDDGFVAQMKRVFQAYNLYMGNQDTWYGDSEKLGSDLQIAYFSMEYGITESLRLYSGGLGILAADHLKSASDLGLPLVGVGLLYQAGYFCQYLNADGWQQEMYPLNDFHNLPLRLERASDGKPLTVEIAFPGRPVCAQIWRAQVGRVPLYLLDTNIAQNRPEDRNVSGQLYGGDMDMRIKQEIVLGIGGVRALRALGVEPTVFHMNEGHSAFLTLERIRQTMSEHHMSFAEARELVAAGNLFTTHTPVPAGIDVFPLQLMDHYFTDYYGELGLSREEFVQLGRSAASQSDEGFSMAILALRLSYSANGVSKRHGSVARKMWCGLWPGTLPEEVPITHVTNGVHLYSWLSHDMASLLERYLGPRWVERPHDRSTWARLGRIPDEELWRTHERRRERLVAVARAKLEQQMARRGVTQQEMAEASEVLDAEALTIGFARRFTTYKRALLLLSDPDRLSKILNDPVRPVQIIFAGKAHPHDNPGKELIRDIIHLARRPDLRRRIIFIEDYDISLARYMVQGVDVWLNTPRQGMEASGTSGMKAAVNGAIHLSTYSGWWYEGYTQKVGWRIGSGERYSDASYGDQVEAQSLYDLLEKEIVPLFYDVQSDRLPRAWIRKMKAAMADLSPVFNTHRMVSEYAERLYFPADSRQGELQIDDCQQAREIAAWKDRVRGHWDNVRIDMIESDAHDGIPVAAEITVRAHVHLGELTPADVILLVYHGNTGPQGDIIDHSVVPMCVDEGAGNGDYIYRATFSCHGSGLKGYDVKLMPRYSREDKVGYGKGSLPQDTVFQCLNYPCIPGLVLWAS